MAVDYTVPNTLTVKQRTAGNKYDPYEVRNAAQILKNNKYADLARNNHEFVPLVAESLGGLGNAAVKLFGEIARSQASSRHPVGHILRRLIDISQIAVQKGNFRRLVLIGCSPQYCIERVDRVIGPTSQTPRAPFGIWALQFYLGDFP